MIARAVFDKLMRQLKVGGVSVHYWDGTSRTYGPDKPYFEMTIKRPGVIWAMGRNLTLGFGEAYMRGDIFIEGDIRQVGRLVSENRSAFAGFKLLTPPTRRQANRRSRQRRQIAHHYDLGNDFYRLWLDESMTYSCAYFHDESDSLEAAQDQKVDYVLRKLQLQPGQTLLDIGCGWGKLLIAAAQQYGVQGYGVTLSQEQCTLAQERIAAAGLQGQVSVELRNYQDLPGSGRSFDRIVSVGMYEHVGRRNHAAYFRAVDALLRPGGLSVLHTITAPGDHPTDAWIDRYIFPGGYLPSVTGTVRVLEAQPFELLDYENLRFHYAMTLDEWLRRFDAHRDEVVVRYGEEFYRMWRLYLGSSTAGFRYGNLGLSQFTFARPAQSGLPLTREHLYR